MNEDHRELDLKVAELLDRVKELEEICFRPASDERKMEQGYYAPTGLPDAQFFITGSLIGNSIKGTIASPSTEVLKVTPEGEFIWDKNASSMIKNGDFTYNPAMKFILERLMAWEEAGWVLNAIDINEFQAKTLDDTIKQSKHAHMTDVDIRINGQNIIREADWIKHLKRK